MKHAIMTLLVISLLGACSADEITSHAECVADLAEDVGARKSGEASANCHVNTNDPTDGGVGGAGGEGGFAPEEPEHHTIVDSQCAGHDDFEVCKYNSVAGDPSKLTYAACFESRCLPYVNTGSNNGHGGCLQADDCAPSPCLEQVCHKGLCLGFWHKEDEGRACLEEVGADATCHAGACVVNG